MTLFQASECTNNEISISCERCAELLEFLLATAEKGPFKVARALRWSRRRDASACTAAATSRLGAFPSAKAARTMSLECATL